ncbi:hypothetical protein HZA98_03875 [Candidatus Woesearchaeota archaeon]|nr:hypothetical protein [Candidatus Woesearchaeota archaeon]
MAVIYNRLKDFTASEMDQIKSLTKVTHDKIRRSFKDAKLIVDVHRMEKAGARCKYSVHLRVDDPSLILSAEQADWDLTRALHEAIANLEQEVQHKYKKGITRKGGPKPLME